MKHNHKTRKVKYKKFKNRTNQRLSSNLASKVAYIAN